MNIEYQYLNSFHWYISKFKSLSDIPFTGDIILIIGNTDRNNIQYAQESETYRINSVNVTDLYGVNAAAIALAYRIN